MKIEITVDPTSLAAFNAKDGRRGLIPQNIAAELFRQFCLHAPTEAYAFFADSNGSYGNFFDILDSRARASVRKELAPQVKIGEGFLELIAKRQQ